MDYEMNMPYTGAKELALAGLSAVGGFALPSIACYAGKKVHPLAGALAGVAAGLATVMYSDRMLQNDSYAKGMAIGGFFGLLKAAWSGISGMMNVPNIPGLRGAAPLDTSANYVLNPFGHLVDQLNKISNAMIKVILEPKTTTVARATRMKGTPRVRSTRRIRTSSEKPPK